MNPNGGKSHLTPTTSLPRCWMAGGSGVDSLAVENATEATGVGAPEAGADADAGVSGIADAAALPLAAGLADAAAEPDAAGFALAAALALAGAALGLAAAELAAGLGLAAPPPPQAASSTAAAPNIKALLNIVLFSSTSAYLRTRRRNCRVRSCCGLSSTSLGRPSSAITPSAINTSRSPTSRAKPISCVTTSMVMPDFARSRITSSTSATSSGSKAEV